MSYPYSAIAIDLKKLAAAAGSKDKKLEAALEKKFAKRYADNDEWFADEIIKGAPTTDVAIFASALDSIKPMLEDDDDADEVRDAFRSWCTKAQKKKLGLMLFAY